MFHPIRFSVSAKAPIGPATDRHVLSHVGYTSAHIFRSSGAVTLQLSRYSVEFHTSAAHAPAGELARISVGSSCISSVAVSDIIAAFGLMDAPRLLS